LNRHDPSLLSLLSSDDSDSLDGLSWDPASTGANSVKASTSSSSSSSSELKVLIQNEHLRTPPTDETVLILKASSTQLISVVIMALLLLPLYEQGFNWWDEGANQFIYSNFDLPRLKLQLSVSFSWPRFSQPKLALQLAVGLMILFVQFLIKFGKWFLFTFSSVFALSDKVPDYWERNMLLFFSNGTWRLFRAPTEISQCVMERLSRDVVLFNNDDDSKKKNQDSELLVQGNNGTTTTTTSMMLKQIAGMVNSCLKSIPLFFLYCIQSPRLKAIPLDSGDNEVLGFCKSENSMAYRSIELIGEGTTSLSLQSIHQCCPWIKVVKLKLSPLTQEGMFVVVVVVVVIIVFNYPFYIL
jgi:hypothetical protein